MVYHLLFENVGLVIEQAIRTLTGKLAAVLYNFIVDLYNVFMIIARAEILDNKYIQAIYNRVGLILGLFMVFKLSFSLIQSLVDPNKFTDEKTGFAGIIKRSVIAIVLLGVTPTIFRFAFDFQSMIVGTENDNSNVIYRLVVESEKIENASTFGNTLAGDLYFSFFKESSDGILSNVRSIIDPDSRAVVVDIESYDTIKKEIKAGTRDFDSLTQYLSLRTDGHYDVEWDVIFSLAAAVAVIYILINYCIAVATRVIQLAYLQLIAPVPILSYIGDPEGTFKKWVNQCVATYLDLFLRLAIIYFIITLSQKILDILNDSTSLAESTGLTTESPEYIWVKIFLLIGLLMFGKRVPELLKELFPGLGSAASLNLGVKNMKNLAADVPIVGGAASKAIGYGTGKVKALGALPFKKAKQGVQDSYNKLWTKPHEQRVQLRKDYREAKDTLREEEKMANKGKAYVNKVGDKLKIDASKFDNEEYKNSFNNLQAAKDKSSKALKDYGANSSQYIEAEKEVKAAKERHELMQKRYYKDAEKEKQAKAYIDREKRKPPQSNGNSSIPPTSSAGSSTGGGNGSTPPTSSGGGNSRVRPVRVNHPTGGNTGGGNGANP